jgi:hypothetical protein
MGTLKRLKEIMNNTLLTWRQNPDEQDSYLAEYKTPQGDVRFEVVKTDEDEDRYTGPLWSYAYILPWVEYPNFFNHDFQYTTLEAAKKAAEEVAWSISVGDE